MSKSNFNKGKCKRVFSAEQAADYIMNDDTSYLDDVENLLDSEDSIASTSGSDESASEDESDTETVEMDIDLDVSPITHPSTINETFREGDISTFSGDSALGDFVFTNTQPTTTMSCTPKAGTSKDIASFFGNIKPNSKKNNKDPDCKSYKWGVERRSLA